MGLDGQVAVVTGAGRGIGRAIALRLAAEGADVAILDLNGAEETAASVRALGRRAYAGLTDISDSNAVGAAADEVTDELGDPTIIVNNAGVIIRKAALDYSDADFETTMRVNLFGPWYVIRHFAARMVRRGEPGSIVNIASATALQATYSRAPYIASKSGVVGLTKALALDLAEYDIRVNAVVPGATKTEIWADFPDDGQGLQQNLFLTPLRRWGRPEDIAAAVSFLVSDDACQITGTLLAVDGGMSAGSPGGMGRWPAIESVQARPRRTRGKPGDNGQATAELSTAETGSEPPR